jgi:hypothetical protein
MQGYDDWVRLANDPRESDASRAAHRASMERHVRDRLREAFELARRSGEGASAGAHPAQGDSADALP